jgi:diamine N-acetyltransferase
MNDAFKLVACQQKHAALLAQLGGSTFYETFAPHNDAADMEAYISKTYSVKAIQENLKKEDVLYFAAYNQETDIGYLKLIKNVQIPLLQGSILEIEKIYVRQEAQGTGVAAKLMEQAIKTAKELTFNELFLGVWQENERAIAFYKKFGFKIFDTRQFQLGQRLCEDYLLHLKIN